MDTAKRIRIIAISSLLAALLAVACALMIEPQQAYAATKLGKVKIAAVKEVSSNSILMEWSKVQGAKKYQVQVSKDKKFKSGVVQGKIKGEKAYLNSDLSKGANIYVRIRAFNSKKVHGKWSAVKGYTYKGLYAGTSSGSSGSSGSSQGGSNAAHQHNYQTGGNYSYYNSRYEYYKSMFTQAAYRYNTEYSMGGPSLNDWSRAQQSSAGMAAYQKKMQEHNARLAELARTRDGYQTEMNYYKDLAAAEYYCTVCGARRPANSSSGDYAAAAANL